MRAVLLRFVFVLAALTVAAAAFAAPQRCRTESPSPAMMAQIQQSLRAQRTACPTGTINVAVHVLQSGATGYVPPSYVAAQIAELNVDYAPMGYTFVLAYLDYTNNAAFYNVDDFSEPVIKTALAIDPAHTLNIYTGLLYGGAYLGFAYYPSSFPENSIEHSVFLDYRSLPGFGFVPYHLGRTATHEVGHYLGLYHTFENGCLAPDDYVADTPRESGPNFGCPIGIDTCPSDPGLDPIHNYMDYTDDACYSEFSPGQGGAMCSMIATYRPSLLSGGPTNAHPRTWGHLKSTYR